MDVAIIGGVAVVISALVGFTAAGRDLAVRRQLDSTGQFLELFSTAHGRPRDGRADVGISEQVAAVSLIAELATRHGWLKTPAHQGLRSMENWVENDELRAAVRAALKRLT